MRPDTKKIDDSCGSNYPISLDAVAWAYRLFLDRDPENHEVVLDKVSRLKNTQELREEFLHSVEFQLKQESQDLGLDERIPWEHQPKMNVGDVQSKDGLEALFNHIQKTWEYLGKTEPHWSVLTGEQYRQSNIEASRDLFYHGGQNNVAALFQSLERNEIDYSSYKSCLEYGCGVGRVTYWLAKKFNLVYGYDISQHHLQIAQEYLDDKHIKNVHLRHVKKVEDALNLPKVDVVYSILVLQHNPPPLMSLLVREFIKALHPGGVAFFQVPTYKIDYRFSMRKYLSATVSKQEMEMHVLPQKILFEMIQQEGGRLLEVIEDGWTGSNKDLSNTVIVQKRKDSL